MLNPTTYFWWNGNESVPLEFQYRWIDRNWSDDGSLACVSLPGIVTRTGSVTMGIGGQQVTVRFHDRIGHVERVEQLTRADTICYLCSRNYLSGPLK